MAASVVDGQMRQTNRKTFLKLMFQYLMKVIVIMIQVIIIWMIGVIILLAIIKQKKNLTVSQMRMVIPIILDLLVICDLAPGAHLTMLFEILGQRPRMAF